MPRISYDFLKENEKDLVTLFIISDAKVSNGSADGAYKGEEVEGLSVKVSQADGDKCERCWMFSTTVGEDPDHPKLCRRCAEVVKKIKF